MSGMIVFDLYMLGINGAEIERWHHTFPQSTCSAKWSAPLKWHQKSSPSSMTLISYHTAHTRWEQIWCDQWKFPRQHNVSVARVLCCLGKFHWSHHRSFLSVYLDCTPYMTYTARTGFLCRSDGSLHITIKVLCGNIYQHLTVTV